MKRYWYSTFLAASLAAVIAVEYVPGAVRKLTPWYEAGAMERETDEGAAKKPDIGAERETREEEIPETADGAGTAAVSGGAGGQTGETAPSGGGDISVRGRGLWLQSPLELRPCP